MEFSQSSLNKWAAAAVLSIYPYAGTLSYGDLKCNIKSDFCAYSYNIISETISYLFVFNCIFYWAFSEVLSQLFCVSFWREITMRIITQSIDVWKHMNLWNQYNIAFYHNFTILGIIIKIASTYIYHLAYMKSNFNEI